MTTEKQSTAEFIPQFKFSFLHPRYWGIWLGVFVLILLTFIPKIIRDPCIGKLARCFSKLAKSARRRANINLLYCFPELNDSQRSNIIDNMFATAAQTMLLLVDLATGKQKRIVKKTIWHGEEHLIRAKENKSNVILLVPHAWGIDIPAMILASKGVNVAGMFHHQKNPLSDWLWNRTRRRFGGRLHSRTSGIKPFIASVRQGYWGYYLPDEDYGEEQSEFVDFFATYKATLPAIGRLMKICHAEVIPLFPIYNAQKHCLEIRIRPPMKDLVDADDVTIARRMNEEVELLIGSNLEQYAWILKLLKTRRKGEIEPYLRSDL